MKVDPTPMAAACWRSWSTRNGGRTTQASASPAKRICAPKSSKAARIRPNAPPAAAPGLDGDSSTAILPGHMNRVGGEVDAFCSKCQLLLAHTVIAMVGAVPVKVECNTCRAVHKFRGASTTVPRRTTPREGKTTISFDELLASQKGAAQRYLPTVLFAAGD